MKTTLLSTILVFFTLLLNAQTDRFFASLDKESVVKRLFDNAEINSDGEILWTPNYSESINNQVSDDNYCHTKMDTIMYYHGNGYDNAVVIFTTYKYENGEKQSCHACAPTIGIAIFEKSSGTDWEIKQFQKSFITTGSFGERDKLSLTRIGKDIYCLTISGGYGNQGYFESDVTYYSLQESDRFNKIFSFQNFSSNEGAVENGFNSKTSIKFLPSKKMYSTIELTTTWSNSKQTKKLLYNYSFENQRYEFTRKVLDSSK